MGTKVSKETLYYILQTFSKCAADYLEKSKLNQFLLISLADFSYLCYLCSGLG